jgi:Domain of unknown function (DUF1906)
MATILDYSAGYPGALAVKRAGHIGVIRYLRKEGSSGVRPITKGEYDDMDRNGLLVALVYQHVSRSRPLGGYAAGGHDARWALARSRELGVDPRCIYFAVDFDTATSQWPIIGEYMRGCGDAIGRGRVGAYGEYSLLGDLFRRGVITWGWQTYAWSAGHNLPGQSRHPTAHLFQRLGQVTVGGIKCDVNDVLKSDFGQVNGDDVSAKEVWEYPITFTPPGRTAPVTFQAWQYLAWGNYYASLTEKLLQVIASNEANDLTEAKLSELLTANVDEVIEQLKNATIDVDVTVGGRAVPEGTEDDGVS